MVDKKLTYVNNYTKKISDLLNIPNLKHSELHSILGDSGVKSVTNKDDKGNYRTLYNRKDLDSLINGMTITGKNRYVSLKTLYDSAKKLGIADNEDEILGSLNKPKKDNEELNWRDGKDMESASNMLLNRNESKGKKITINESTFKRLFENIEDEGFDFYDKNQRMKFNPSHQRNADTSIFKPNTKEFNVKKVLLPKSQIMSYNLYDIKQMNVNRGLKHGQNVKGEDMDITDHSITNFIRRTALYIKSIIGNKPVDIITYPESSSRFNNVITSRLTSMFPSSYGIQLKPEMMVKNVRGIYVNVDVAKEVGLTNDEIYTLQNRVDKWKADEDIREYRRGIKKLGDKIYELTKNRGRGRPSKEVTNYKDSVNFFNKEIDNMRKGRKGRDATKDSDGNVKNWQIKSIDDKHRKSIEGIFTLNQEYLSMQYKFKNKHIILFDDNLSSGATLDDVCLALQHLGVASITPFTLGVIPATIYNPKDRYDDEDN